MTTDEQALVEDNGRLREEVKHLKEQVEKTQANLSALRRMKATVNIIQYFPLLTGGAAVLWFFAWLLVHKIGAPDKVDHCQIQQEVVRVPEGYGNYVWRASGRSVLVGIVPWGTDVEHGTFPSLQDAVTAAKLLSCPLR